MKKGFLWILVLVPVLAVCAVMNGIVAVGAQTGEKYSFEVFNTTKSSIKELLASEDKKTWGEFDVEDGIKPGKSMELEWDEATRDENCRQWLKAVYADESESEPAKFNFCEKGLEVEF